MDSSVILWLETMWACSKIDASPDVGKKDEAKVPAQPAAIFSGDQKTAAMKVLGG